MHIILAEQTDGQTYGQIETLNPVYRPSPHQKNNILAEGIQISTVNKI